MSGFNSPLFILGISVSVSAVVVDKCGCVSVSDLSVYDVVIMDEEV